MIGLPYGGSALVHGLWMALGILAGLAYFGHEVRRRRLADDRLWVLAGLAVAFGAVGSRLLTWPQELVGNPSIGEWWMDGNRSVLAGLVGAWAGVLLGKRITAFRQPTGDLFAPAVALAMTIGRVGCLLTELPGVPTGGTWGMVLRPDQAAILGGPSGVGLHPSFAYEIVFQAAAFVLLVRFRDALPKPGDLFIVYVATYAGFRFLVEFVRGNDPSWYGLTLPQWFLATMIPLLVWRLWRVWHPREDARMLDRSEAMGGAR